MKTQTAIIALAVVAAILLAGCGGRTQPPIELYSAFDADEARKLLQKGENTIKGSALLRQRNGGVVSCAGNLVLLVPNTEYAAERMRHVYGNTKHGEARLHGKGTFTPDYPEFHDLRKETVCDVQGYFSFKEIADGSFFVLVVVDWEIFKQSTFTNFYTGQLQSITIPLAEGRFLMQEVSVSDVETKEIVLTR